MRGGGGQGEQEEGKGSRRGEEEGKGSRRERGRGVGRKLRVIMWKRLCSILSLCVIQCQFI